MKRQEALLDALSRTKVYEKTFMLSHEGTLADLLGNLKGTQRCYSHDSRFELYLSRHTHGDRNAIILCSKYFGAKFFNAFVSSDAPLSPRQIIDSYVSTFPRSANSIHISE